MHENREISSTPWSDERGRSAKVTSRTADMYVPEESDCVALPVNQPKGRATFRGGRGGKGSGFTTASQRVPALHFRSSEATLA
jgi:hypothetical protein